MSDVVAIRLDPTQILTRSSKAKGLITYPLPPEWDHDTLLAALGKLTEDATYLLLLGSSDGEILVTKPTGNDPIISCHILLSQLDKPGTAVPTALALQAQFYHSRCRVLPTPQDRTGIMVLQDDHTNGGTISFFVAEGNATPVRVNCRGLDHNIHPIDYTRPLSRMPWVGSEYALAFAAAFPELPEILVWSPSGLEVAHGWGGADSCFRQDIKDATGDYRWRQFIVMDIDADLRGACLLGQAGS